MADVPITWQLVLLIQAQLQTVRVANGYFTDIGTSVFTERSQVQQGNTPYAVVTLKKTTRSGVGPRLQRNATFTVEAGIPTGVDSTNAMETAHKVLADLERALNTESPQSINRVRYALSTDTDIQDRPDGLKAILVIANGTANYMPV